MIYQIQKTVIDKKNCIKLCNYVKSLLKAAIMIHKSILRSSSVNMCDNHAVNAILLLAILI